MVRRNEEVFPNSSVRKASRKTVEEVPGLKKPSKLRTEKDVKGDGNVDS